MKTWRGGTPWEIGGGTPSIGGGVKSPSKESVAKRRGRRPKLSSSQKAEIFSLYLDGYSVDEISEFYGVSHMTVYRVINAHFSRFKGKDVDEVFNKVKKTLWGK